MQYIWAERKWLRIKTEEYRKLERRFVWRRIKIKFRWNGKWFKVELWRIRGINDENKDYTERKWEEIPVGINWIKENDGKEMGNGEGKEKMRKKTRQMMNKRKWSTNVINYMKNGKWKNREIWREEMKKKSRNDMKIKIINEKYRNEKETKE